jgi:hypothetical protein
MSTQQALVPVEQKESDFYKAIGAKGYEAAIAFLDDWPKAIQDER